MFPVGLPQLQQLGPFRYRPVLLVQPRRLQQQQQQLLQQQQPGQLLQQVHVQMVGDLFNLQQPQVQQPQAQLVGVGGVQQQLGGLQLILAHVQEPHVQESAEETRLSHGQNPPPPPPPPPVRRAWVRPLPAGRAWVRPLPAGTLPRLAPTQTSSQVMDLQVTRGGARPTAVEVVDEAKQRTKRPLPPSRPPTQAEFANARAMLEAEAEVAAKRRRAGAYLAAAQRAVLGCGEDIMGDGVDEQAALAEPVPSDEEPQPQDDDFFACHHPLCERAGLEQLAISAAPGGPETPLHETPRNQGIFSRGNVTFII